MSEQRRQPKNPGEAIYFAALDAREFSQNLQPLLQLLDESEGPGPIDELKSILTAIIEILAKQNQDLAHLKSVCEGMSTLLNSIEPTSVN